MSEDVPHSAQILPFPCRAVPDRGEENVWAARINLVQTCVAAEQQALGEAALLLREVVFAAPDQYRPSALWLARPHDFFPQVKVNTLHVDVPALVDYLCTDVFPAQIKAWLESRESLVLESQKILLDNNVAQKEDLVAKYEAELSVILADAGRKSHLVEASSLFNEPNDVVMLCRFAVAEDLDCLYEELRAPGRWKKIIEEYRSTKQVVTPHSEQIEDLCTAVAGFFYHDVCATVGALVMRGDVTAVMEQRKIWLKDFADMVSFDPNVLYQAQRPPLKLLPGSDSLTT